MNLEQYKAEPTDYFDSPQAVLDHPGLSAEDKKEILVSWKDELVQLQTATEENMPQLDPEVHKEASLGQVARALEQLEASLDRS